MKAAFNSHKVSNLINRLRSIVDCMEADGKQFFNEKVYTDVILTLEDIKNEFQIIREDKNEENN